jgi:hypothetical protein
MCLTFRKSNISIKEAEEKIKTVKKQKTVYKMFRFYKTGDKIKLYAPIKAFEYHLGQRYTSKIDIQKSYYGNVVVEAGLHAFHRKKGYMRGMDRSPHMYVLIPCIIPAGGRYILGTDNEIVSDTLVLPDSFICKGEEYNINY